MYEWIKGHKWICFTLLLLTFFLIYCFLCTPIRAYTSDNASAVWEASSILRGNILLKNWIIPADNFITSDILFYLPFLPFLGIGTTVIVIVSSLIYTTILLFSLLLGIKEKNNKILSGIIIICMVALPSAAFMQYVLNIPIHTGTLLYTLIVFYVTDQYISRKEAKISWHLGVICIIAFSGLFADPVYQVLALLPLFLVLLPISTKKNPHRKQALSLLITVITSYILYSVAVLYILPAYGFTIVSHGYELTTLPGLIWNMRLFINIITHTFGPLSGISWIHILQLLFLISTFIFSIILIVQKKLDMLDWLLLLSAIFDIVIFCISRYPESLDSTRYFIPAFVMLGILGARHITTIPIDKKYITYSLEAIATIVLLVSLIEILTTVPVQTRGLTSTWLLSHHITYAYADYWDSEITWLHTKGKVSVYPIRVFPENITPYYWLSDNTWYKKEVHTIIFKNAEDWNFSAINIVKVLGEPQNKYTTNGYSIWIWQKDISKDISTFGNFGI